jgi:hypothetical protein
MFDTIKISAAAQQALKDARVPLDTFMADVRRRVESEFPRFTVEGGAVGFKVRSLPVPLDVSVTNMPDDQSTDIRTSRESIEAMLRFCRMMRSCPDTQRQFFTACNFGSYDPESANSRLDAMIAKYESKLAACD